MLPIPFVSQWNDKPVFLIVVKRKGELYFATAPEGVQPDEATVHVNRAEALRWLADNGFTRRQV